MYVCIWKLHINIFSQALCEAVAKTKIMNAEQVVRDEQGEEVILMFILYAYKGCKFCR